MNALISDDNLINPSITISGGGFSGTTAFLHAASKIERDWITGGKPNQPPITINIIEPRPEVGPGDPYSHETDVYSLNQPAYAMSPFDSNPEHFTNHIAQQRGIESLIEAGDVFASRHEYGLYLKQTFQNALRRIKEEGIPINVTCIQSKVTDAAFNGENFDVVTTDGTLQTNSLIIADGHQRNGFLSELRGQRYYFEEETSPSIIQSIPNQHGRVLIVGSGQTMMDRLSELENARYQGDIVLVSRRGVMPWEFKPELYRDIEEVMQYELQHFTPENTKNQNYSELLKLWEREIGAAEAKGKGPVHVLAQYLSREDEFADQSENPDFKRIAEYIQAYYGNPTPPHKYKMLHNLRTSGRLKQINSGMSTEQIKHQEDGGFAVQMKDADGTNIQVDAIFNSAGCARTLLNPNSGLIRSPLIAKLDDKGLMQWGEASGILVAGEQRRPGLYYAGPYAYDGKWGVETFRKGVQATAEAAVEHMYTQQTIRVSPQ